MSKTEKIIALKNLHVTELKTDEKISSPSFLKSLSTKTARDTWKVSAPHLCQPNLIAGVAAGGRLKINNFKP